MRLYVPYGAKLCFNGHEYLKRQLAKEGIVFQELDNGILSCDDPNRMQQLAERLSPARIERFLRKWQRELPCPFRAVEQRAGYRYDVSMRENLDLGRPANSTCVSDPVVFALFSVLVFFRLLPCGFRSRDLREHLSALLGDDPSQWTQGRLTYQLRRLRLHGLIERIENTHRYAVTERGYRVALWLSRCQSRVLRPSLGELLSNASCFDETLQTALARFDKHVDQYFQAANLRHAA